MRFPLANGTLCKLPVRHLYYAISIHGFEHDYNIVKVSETAFSLVDLIIQNLIFEVFIVFCYEKSYCQYSKTSLAFAETELM